MSTQFKEIESPFNSGAITLKSGAGAPLYCLYGMYLYKQLANCLPDTQSVVGLYTKQEVELLFDTEDFKKMDLYSHMDSIVNSYISIIRASQPSGPYYLGGASFGGIIALEAARKLKRSGELVPLVVMMDSWHPDASLGIRGIKRIYRHLSLLVGSPVQYSKKLMKLSIVKRLIKRNAGSETDQKKRAMLDRADEYRKHVVRAYNSESYEGKVIIYRAASKELFYRESDALGWDKYLTDYEVKVVPGDHLGILKNPNVRIMADHLTHFLPGGNIVAK